MKWNEYAQVGAKLQEEFRGLKFDDPYKPTDVSFVFDILDRIHMAEGYSLKVLPADYIGIGDVSRLVAIPDGLEYEPTRRDMEEAWYNVEAYIVVESSEMGAFQAQLLKFASSWMPYFWHGGYKQRIFAFCDEDFRYFGGDDNSIPTFFINDERLNPVVELNGEEVAITCCYWNDWKGLVRARFLGRLHNNRLLTAYVESECEIEQEALYPYNCGILF